MNTLLGYHSIMEQFVFAVVSILWATSCDTQLKPGPSQTDDPFLILIGEVKKDTWKFYKRRHHGFTQDPLFKCIIFPDYGNVKKFSIQ